MPDKESGSVFTDLLFSVIFGAIFALKLQTLYAVSCGNQNYDISQALDTFAVFAVYSIFFVYAYWRWVHPFKVVSMRTTIRTVTASLAPYLGWEFSFIEFFFSRGIFSRGFWACLPTFSTLNIPGFRLDALWNFVLYIFLSTLQFAIVIKSSTGGESRNVWKKRFS